MTEDATPTPEKAKAVGVARPRVECFATQLTVAKSNHPSVGDACTIMVESGDLEMFVHLPLQFAAAIGRELVGLESGLKIAGAEDLSKLSENGKGKG
jgi:hypothetical protein